MFFLFFSETMESLMTDHCNAFAARAVGSPFGFGAPFGLPPPPSHLAGGMHGFEYAAAAAAQGDPTMAAILRERAMLLGFGAGGPQALANQISAGYGGRLPPGMGPNAFGMAPPVNSSGTSPQFWSQSKPTNEPSMNEQMYQMQQQQWYQALAAANGGRLPPGAIPPPPPNGAASQLHAQFANLAAMNPQLWAAMIAYGSNGSVPPNGMPANHPHMAKMMSPTFLKTMQLEQEAAMHGKGTSESPRKEGHMDTGNANSQVATES